MNIFNYALELIFPQTCGICEKVGEGYICSNCYQEIQKYLYKGNLEEEKFHLLQYKGLVREKMIQYKFDDKAYLYRMFCGILMKNKNACEFIKSYDIIIPVPIHKKRKKQRGYNQSELIASKISKELKIEIGLNILKKQIHTLPQSSLKKEERIKNVQNVYKVYNVQKIKSKNVLVLDDIYTTGATTKECKSILKLLGANKVGIFTIAKD